MSLRSIAEGIAEFIANDNVIHDCGTVSVLVEDKANVAFEVANALSRDGVSIVIATTDFKRTDASPIVQGILTMQISCIENPELNRDDAGKLTAQAAMERIAHILHCRRFGFLSNPLLFDNFARQDTDEANVVQGTFTVNTKL